MRRWVDLNLAEFLYLVRLSESWGISQWQRIISHRIIASLAANKMLFKHLQARGIKVIN